MKRQYVTPNSQEERAHHATMPWCTIWGNTRVGQEAEGVREEQGQEFLLWFPWEE